MKRFLFLLPLLMAGCPVPEIIEAVLPPAVVFTNVAPVPNAGPNQTANSGETVLLMGTDTSDPDGDNLTWYWAQVDGPEVRLLAPFSSITAFVAPDVEEMAELRFLLIVSDGHRAADDSVVVTVEP